MTELAQFTLNSTPSDKPIYISGLDLRGMNNPLLLQGTQPITLQNSTFTACSNCLAVEGNQHTIGNNVSIECGDKEGIGLLVTGDDHLIQDTEIQKCGVGVQIGNAESAGNGIEMRTSEIHDNHTGISLVQGTANYFREDENYLNDSNGDNNFSQLEGILFGENANSGVQNPTPLLTEERKFLSYAPDIEELTQEDVPATFRIASPYARGEIEVLLTEERNPAEGEDEAVAGPPVISAQAREFYAVARLVGNEGIQNGHYLLRYELPMNETVENKFAVLLLQHNTFGSATYTEAVELNDPGVLSAAGMDTPAAGGGPAGIIGGDVGAGSAGGDIGAGGGGSVIADPGVAPPGTDDEEESTGGQGVGGLTVAGDAEGPASVITGGIGATGAPGGIGSAKGGCTLTPGPFSTPPPLILLVAITGLVWIRRRY